MDEVKEVGIVGYDPSWPSRYTEEAGLVGGALGARAIEHVGSTAVPGLEGKPTIDILVGTERLEVGEEERRAMEALGYRFRGEAGVPERLFFRKGASFPRDFNVHVAVFEGAFWNRLIGFRDYLRTDPDAAEKYAALKRELVRSGGSAEMGSYAAGKAGFIEEIDGLASGCRG